MKIRVLGCSGGIAKGVATTSFLIDDDILIDAGTGVGDLRISEMRRIKHIFITHSHLDHTSSLALLVDTLFEHLVGQPITVHTQRSTIKVLKEHIFNWVVWPDFAQLPSKEAPVLGWQVMKPGEVVELEGRRIEMSKVRHTVPAVGYRMADGDGSFAFTGDTTTNDTLWDGLNKLDRLDHLIVESAFSNGEMALCEMSKHYCPQLLAADLQKLRHDPQIYFSHAKPGGEEMIYHECRQLLPERTLHHLTGGEHLAL